MNLASAFTTMANTVATAFRPSTPLKEILSQSTSISQIDLQPKILNQIDMLHKIFEHGGITSNQYEKRRDDLLAQLDTL